MSRVDFEAIASESREILLEVVSLLGLTLAVDKTPAPASSQEVLGVSCSLETSRRGLHLLLSLEDRKLQVWIKEAQQILLSESVDLRRLTRLVGRLSFASWAIWRQVARSRLRAAYSFLLSGSESHRRRMVLDLEWWLSLLQRPLPAQAGVSSGLQDPVVVYTDAEGSSGLGAVLHTPSKTVWFQDHVPSAVSAALSSRRTQIFAYEVIAVWAATQRFSSQLSGQHVVFFIDNKSALRSLLKGSSRASDVHLLVRRIWDLLRQHNIKPTFKWVPSKLNLSDLPSRGRPPVVGSMVPSSLTYSSLTEILSST